jgi:hypothetical protein
MGRTGPKPGSRRSGITVDTTGLDKLKLFGKQLNANYGVGAFELYLELFAGQQGKCAICHRKSGAGRQRIGIDHDHGTGKIRALLCQQCNAGLGMFQDNPFILIAAAVYLLRYRRDLTSE